MDGNSTLSTISNLVTDVLESNLTDSGNGSWWDDWDLYVHPHWKQYDMDALPDWGHYIVGIYIGIVGITGVIGNFTVIFMFLR